MKTIQYILLAVAMMFATTSFAQISSDNDSRAGNTCVLFNAAVSLPSGYNFIEVSVVWERSNGQLIYPPAQYSYTTIAVGTELYFQNTSPFTDIVRTRVDIRRYKNGTAMSGTGLWFSGFSALVVYDTSKAWMLNWWETIIGGGEVYSK